MTENQPSEFQDRRVETAVAIAVQAQQLKELSTDVCDLKKLLTTHIGVEESEFQKIHDCLNNLNQSTDNKIQEAVGPLQKEITRYKTIINYTMWLFGGAVSLLVMFKDYIVRFFH